MNLFTYGTLMDIDVMKALTGAPMIGSPSWLKNYTRHPVRNACYPGIIPATGTLTRGILFQNLPSPLWPLFDWFEDNLYQRTCVTVQTHEQANIQAQAYIIHPEKTHSLNPTLDWSFKHFLERDKTEYLRMCKQAPLHFQHQTESSL